MGSCSIDGDFNQIILQCNNFILSHQHIDHRQFYIFTQHQFIAFFISIGQDWGIDIAEAVVFLAAVELFCITFACINLPLDMCKLNFLRLCCSLIFRVRIGLGCMNNHLVRKQISRQCRQLYTKKRTTVSCFLILSCIILQLLNFWRFFCLFFMLTLLVSIFIGFLYFFRICLCESLFAAGFWCSFFT